MMRITISLPGVIVGVLIGSIIRFAVTYSEMHDWFNWFNNGLHASPGTAGFAGFVDNNIYLANKDEIGFCLVLSLFPGLIGGAVGALSGATGRPFIGGLLGGIISGLVLLLMRLPELFRPGWSSSAWYQYNASMIVEVMITGTVIGFLSGGFGWLLGRRLRVKTPTTA